MQDESMDDPRHDDIRGVLRVIGPASALVGLVFLTVGLVSFFSAFGTFEPPRHFWCVFVGMPLLAVGVGITKFAFLGSIVRYLARETAPVGKDTFNYVARETGPAAGDFAREVSRGIAEGLRSPDAGRPGPSCPRCGTGSAPSAHYCSHCGAQLAPPGA